MKPKPLLIACAGEWYTVEAHEAKYVGGNARISLRLVTGEPFATLSINTKLRPRKGCFFLKEYGENEEVAAQFLEAGLIEKTGRWADSGPMRHPEVRMSVALLRSITAAPSHPAMRDRSSALPSLLTSEQKRGS
jgi:hypothetical protein